MKVKSVYHKKEDRANQSPAPSARSVIVQPDVVVGGGVPRRLLYSALNSIEKSKSFPPLSVIVGGGVIPLQLSSAALE